MIKQRNLIHECTKCIGGLHAWAITSDIFFGNWTSELVILFIM